MDSGNSDLSAGWTKAGGQGGQRRKADGSVLSLARF